MESSQYGTFLVWLRETGVVDLTGVIGFLITIVGFAVAIRKASRSEDAAKRAEAAANSAVQELTRIEGFIDLSGAIAAMESVKTIHREGAWAILPDRYAHARKLLIGVRSRGRDLTVEQKELLSGCILTFSNLERQAEKYRLDTSKINVTKANSQLSDDVDKMVELLHEIRVAQGG